MKVESGQMCSVSDMGSGASDKWLFSVVQVSCSSKWLSCMQSCGFPNCIIAAVSIMFCSELLLQVTATAMIFQLLTNTHLNWLFVELYYNE